MERKNALTIALIWVLGATFFPTLQLGGIANIAYVFEYILFITLPIITFFIGKEKELRWQFFFVPLSLLCIWGFGLFNSSVWHRDKMLIFIGGISSFIACFYLLLKIISEMSISRFLKAVKNNIFIIILDILFIILSIPVLDNIPFMDEIGYYIESKYMIYGFDYTFSNIDEFLFSDHLCLGYSIPSLMVDCVSLNLVLMHHLLNIFIAVIAITLLYKTFRVIYENKNVVRLITILVAFSPFMLGMVGLITLDAFTLYLFIILISSYFLEYRIIEFISAYLFVFTKEPNVIYYAFLCVGILIIEVYKSYGNVNRSNLLNRVANIVKYYIYEIIIPINWYISFKLLGDKSWISGMSTWNDGYHYFGFTVNNLVYKFWQICVLNFNWLLLLLVIVLGIIELYKLKFENSRKVCIRYTNVLRWRILIISSFLGMVLFNLIYIDGPTMRYVACCSICFLLICIDIIITVCKPKVSYVMLSTLISLLFIQSFVSIDPITPLFATRVTNFGDNMLVNAKMSGITDDCVYNREYSYYNKALNKALAEVTFNDGDSICFYGVPFVYPNLYYDVEKKILRGEENLSTVPVPVVKYDDISNHDGRVIVITNMDTVVDDRTFKTAKYLTMSLQYCVY